ncbi:MAG: hypothetical protein ACI976_002051 [Aureispira sp.]|jgi:hypothetical protein
MLKCCLIYLFISTSIPLLAQNTLDWVQLLGGNGADYVSKIVVDQQANVYGIGHFRDSLNQNQSFGNEDILIFKYNPNGQLIWTKQLGSIGEDLGKDIAINDNGDLFITGHYRNTLYYDNDSLVSLGNTDAFVAKLDLQGNFSWVKSIGNTGFETGTSIACDPLGNSYVAGTFEDSLSINNQNLQTYGTLNNFIIQLNPAGNLGWKNSIGTPTFDNLKDIQLDANGNVYVVGHFRAVLSGTLGQLNSNGDQDALLLKLDTNGQLLWWKNQGGSFADYGFALKIQAPYLYWTGAYKDSMLVNGLPLISAGEYDAFLIQADLQGNTNWIQEVGGLDDSKGLDLATTSDGKIYLAGYFEGTALWANDSFSSRSPRHVPSDIFISEYSSNGSYLSVQTMQGPMNDFATGIVAIDSSFYVTGVCQDSIYFDSLLEISQAGSLDIFIAKYHKSILTNLAPTHTSTLNCQLYPNPSQALAHLDFELKETSFIELIIHTYSGQILRRFFQANQASGQQKITFKTAGLPNGFYYIEIKTKDQYQQLPLIIQH